MAMAKPWNPMEDAYKNKNFNKYTKGPGADLDENLQPGAMATNDGGTSQKQPDRFQICLKGVPSDMSEKAIWNLCASYARLTFVRRTAKTPYVFVTFPTLNDMERALEGIRRDNPQGITADMAKQTASNYCNSNTSNSGSDRKSDRPDRHSDAGSSGGPDMSKRDSKETTDNLKRLAINSKGSYNAEKDEFVKECSQFDQVAAEIQYCTLCRNLAAKVCQRCGDYYCSIECQKKDWSRHRLICFPMPELIAPVHVPHISSTGSVRSEQLSPVPNLNSSSETIKPRQNRIGENRQQRGNDNKRDHHQDGGGQRDRHQKDQQESRKNDWNNKNKNQHDNRRNDLGQKDKERESIVSGGSKKDFGQRAGSNKGNAQSESSKDGGNHKAENRKHLNKQSIVGAPAKAENPQPVSMPRAEYPKSGSIVSITAVIRPNKVYIRSMASEDNVEYVGTVNSVNNKAKAAKPLSGMPKKGDFVITDFQGDGFYRALVLNPESEDKILVAFVDFGNVDFKKLSNLKEIPRELIGLKRQALNVVLKGVEDFEPTTEIQEYMNSFVDAVDKDLRIVYETQNGKGPLEVELIEVSSNANFNKRITELRNIKPAAFTDEPVLSGDIIMKALPQGKDTTLIVLDTSLIQTGTISCVLEKDLAEIDSMTAMFADYAKDTKGPYTPRQHEVCLVLYDDGCWYRAECIEVVGDQNPSVIFTDFGNIATVHIDKIRKYPRKLIMPCVTITCVLGGIPEDINEALANRLKELIPANEKIVANKVDVIDEQTNSIYLDGVVKTLTDEKLI